MEETLTWANPIETEKIRTHHAKIVVECTTGKPYYSIEWFDHAKQEYFLGYSSYNIENVLSWLAECFEIVEAPKTNADRFRAMSDEELAKALIEVNDSGCHIPFCVELPECSRLLDEGEIPEEKCIGCMLNWLKQPAEGE